MRRVHDLIEPQLSIKGGCLRNIFNGEGNLIEVHRSVELLDAWRSFASIQKERKKLYHACNRHPENQCLLVRLIVVQKEDAVKDSCLSKCQARDKEYE